MWHNSSTETTLLWYDYETWGADPARDRLAQFAAIRTDLNLNPVDAPINLLCKPCIDTVIDPMAVAITGLSPIELTKKGLTEWAFASEIEQHFSKPGTCTAGYNTIRFDDECTRFLFYRNLIDPYAREWKNNNSRWDLLDVMRMAHALRPEGIEWPLHEDGSPSFKLEHLTQANGLAHENAHDAVSDVKATIALARLLKEKQPKLYDFAFALRSKHQVRKYLDLEHHNCHLHFSGKIAAKEACLGVEVPLMVHPERANEVIVVDVRQHPSWLMDHDPEDIRHWLYSKTEDLPAGIARPPLRTIHLNRSPMVAPFTLLDEAACERLSLNREEIEKHTRWVQAHPELNRLALTVFTSDQQPIKKVDAEHALYQGFIDDHDRNLLNRFRQGKIPTERWLHETHALHDERLPTLIENILGRHFPESLDDKQVQAWCSKRQFALNSPDHGQSLTIDNALDKIPELEKQYPDIDAWADTQEYLLSLKAHWFDTPLSPELSTLPSASKASEIDESDSSSRDHQQLDLF